MSILLLLEHGAAVSSHSLVVYSATLTTIHIDIRIVQMFQTMLHLS